MFATSPGEMDSDMSCLNKKIDLQKEKNMISVANYHRSKAEFSHIWLLCSEGPVWNLWGWLLRGGSEKQR